MSALFLLRHPSQRTKASVTPLALTVSYFHIWHVFSSVYSSIRIPAHCRLSLLPFFIITCITRDLSFGLSGCSGSKGLAVLHFSLLHLSLFPFVTLLLTLTVMLGLAVFGHFSYISLCTYSSPLLTWLHIRFPSSLLVRYH
ncbi:hypothetical protein BJ508DRAFT_26781 [Ascobolus immersus RN42]|uniref:Uncharacterized protein n=1 Tax=Ascobolus immersus RN42 TaxID=1160509 RepID=A0A3N4IF44_ASCIM|nr:hypothetical protein BJ508DRAFT_26781 [Ascobolus immersus RN42]